MKVKGIDSLIAVSVMSGLFVIMIADNTLGQAKSVRS